MALEKGILSDYEGCINDSMKPGGNELRSPQKDDWLKEKKVESKFTMART